MRKLVTAIPVVCLLSLTGCATPGGITPDTITAGVAEVKKWADTFCSFVPTDATVRAIIASFTGGVDYVAVARGLCDAVTAKAARPGGPPPKYRNVTIRGRFVR